MAKDNSTLNESSELYVRREKLRALKETGRDPFLVTRFDVTDDSCKIKENFEEYE